MGDLRIMKMHVDPDRIEELGRQLKNFSYNIEDMYQYVYNMVTRLVETVEAKYHESYVRSKHASIKGSFGKTAQQHGNSVPKPAGSGDVCN